MKVRVAVLPRDPDGLSADVLAAGGEIAGISEAQAIFWTDSDDPEGLSRSLRDSPAEWIQLPFAGTEQFFEADVIDRKHVWTCAKGIYGPSTAEHALTLILAAARHISHYATSRTWEAKGGERRLKDASLLIVGMGGIGRSLASMLKLLEAHVIAVNRLGGPIPGGGRAFTSDFLPRLIPDADFIVLAAALTAETRGLFGEKHLALMKPDAWLVNVARGRLVNTEALVSALENRSIGGAALDVVDPEPLPDNHPLWALDNVLITPHIGNTWQMGLPEFRALIRRNIRNRAVGAEMEGRVDHDLGY